MKLTWHGGMTAVYINVLPHALTSLYKVILPYGKPYAHSAKKDCVMSGWPSASNAALRHLLGLPKKDLDEKWLKAFMTTQ